MGASCIHALRTVLLKRSHQLRNRTGFLANVVIIAVEHLQKCPLRPFVVFGITGAHLTIPIEAETNFIELFPITVDVLFGGHSRMLTGLNRILLSRQSESIVTHRVQYVKSFETFVPRIDIRSDITQRMADMQTRSRRVWEHIQHIILRAIFINLDFVGFSFGPTALPLLLNGPEIVFHIVDFVLSLSHLRLTDPLKFQWSIAHYLFFLRTESVFFDSGTQIQFCSLVSCAMLCTLRRVCKMP